MFGARVSPLTGSPRLAVNPPNAVLNYLYAILESEARLSAYPPIVWGVGVYAREKGTTPGRRVEYVFCSFFASSDGAPSFLTRVSFGIHHPQLVAGLFESTAASSLFTGDPMEPDFVEMQATA
jgi:hypothetical protein